jgi:hypothetical protein
MSDVMSCDDKGRHYGMQNDRKNRGKMGGFVTQVTRIVQPMLCPEEWNCTPRMERTIFCSV